MGVMYYFGSGATKRLDTSQIERPPATILGYFE